MALILGEITWTPTSSWTIVGNEIYAWHTGATFSSINELLVTESPLDWINKFPIPHPTPEIDFTWSPTEPPLTYIFGNTLFNTGALQTRTNVPITFNASWRYPTYKRWWPVWFHWDFGDGTEGWGETVSHTYIIANPYCECTLSVKDNYGYVISVTRRMLLIRLSDIVMAPRLTTVAV